MQRLLDVPAPAKLNLFLHVTGRRPDGYHLLQSVFMLIDWADTLHFDKRSDGRISREDIDAQQELPEQDLCVRAAEALRVATGCRDGVHISLHKRVPSQAGLGGGSSDAASCLIALNRLWGLGLSRSDLASIGLGLGADVPFFIGGRHAWVEGIGDELLPLDLAAARFAVLKPPSGLSTPAIFSSASLKRDTPRATLTGFAADTYGFGQNDLQAVALALCPEVEQALNLLASWGQTGRMTGSGSAVFAHLTDDESAWERALLDLPPGWVGRTCSNLPIHPLHGWLEQKE